MSKWDDLSFSKRIGNYITIHKNKTIFMSTYFLKNCGINIEKNPRVILGFSPKNNAIVFEFTEQHTAGTVKLSNPEGNRNKSKSKIICGKSFFAKNNINTEIKKTYIPISELIYDKKSCWVIYLDNPIVTDK